MCFLPFLSRYQGQQEQQIRIYKATVLIKQGREETVFEQKKSALSRESHGQKAKSESPETQVRGNCKQKPY